MLPLRHARRWQFAGIAVLVIVLAATLMPAIGFIDEMRDPRIAHSDKWFHAITFMLLTIWFSGQYAKQSYWRIAVGMLVFGAFIEVCQRMLTTWRSAELMDLVADAIGVLAGLLIARAGVGGWSLRVEQWIAARS
ncbi:MAG TPA: VanZ family protein [Woeseiaceae bacterium]|nr:VanZ family protein [Woeseiaceae bacterium]